MVVNRAQLGQSTTDKTGKGQSQRKRRKRRVGSGLRGTQGKESRANSPKVTRNEVTTETTNSKGLEGVLTLPSARREAPQPCLDKVSVVSQNVTRSLANSLHTNGMHVDATTRSNRTSSIVPDVVVLPTDTKHVTHNTSSNPKSASPDVEQPSLLDVDTQRPYLTKNNQVSKSSSPAALDLNKLLATTAPISWGALLGLLPTSTTTNLLQCARAATSAALSSSKEGAAETLLIAETVQKVHENMFAPFTVVTVNPVTGALKRDNTAWVHWAHIDTGAQVNIVHRGVVNTFVELQAYHKPYQHCVKGVGGIVQAITGKLEDVPVSLGDNQGKGTLTRVTFYVLEQPTYHWLFGLPLLAAIHGEVLCAPRVLKFRLHRSGGRAMVALPLHDRSTVPTRPVWQHFEATRASATNQTERSAPSADSVSECWQATFVSEIQAEYVGQSLIDVLAFAVAGEQIVTGPEVLGSCGSDPECELQRNNHFLVENVSLGTIDEGGMCVNPDGLLPEAVAAAQVLASIDHSTPCLVESVAPRQYTRTKPKSGKPLSKAPIRQLNEQLNCWCIVVTGPDYVGCTTLLRVLEQQGHQVRIATDKGGPSRRLSFDAVHFELLVNQWQSLPDTGPSFLVEDSPWSYLTRVAPSITPLTRAALTASLAQLKLPTLTIVLNSSGRQIGLRHPNYQHCPERYAPTALQQMQQLAMLTDPCIHVDATPSISVVAERVERVLARRVFHVSAAFDGMDHLQGTGPSMLTAGTARDFATGLGLKSFSFDTAGMQRLEKLARLCKINAKLVNPTLSTSQKAPYYQVLHDNVEAFALDLSDLASPAVVQPFEVVTFGPPAARPPIRLSPAHASFVEGEVQKLRDAGFVSVGATPWASPCFPVPKPRSTKLRLVTDFRPLNAQTLRDATPLPHTKDVILRIGHHFAWTKADLMSGFWQVPVEPNSVSKLGCCTPSTLFMWHRMPMGVRNGPPCFQRAMNDIIAQNSLQDTVGCFVDDLATGGSTHAACAANTGKMLAMLHGANLKAGGDKVFLGLTEMPFLGFLLRGGRVLPDPSKVECIKSLEPPQTRSELRGFLGLTGYYREFVHRYSAIARPLTLLLKEDTAWDWTAACQEAFETLKAKLMCEPILALPEPDRQFTVDTDFSHLAVSAVLSQVQSDGRSHVIAYASRTCSLAESKLGPTDGELLALVYSVQKFHHYLAGSKFVVISDHDALRHLHYSRTRNPKLARWAMKLAGYDFVVKHRPGRVHNNADGLSRSRQAPSVDTPPASHSALDDPQSDYASLVQALDVLDTDVSLDNLPFVAELADTAPLQGPRQLLLESAPCASCHGHLLASDHDSLVCDRCNAPYHLRCTRLHRVPQTYWYCTRCTSLIRSRGILCPTEDLALQRYLLTGQVHPTFKEVFATRASNLAFTDQLYIWRHGQWFIWPPKGLQLLLMEERHVQHHHVGGDKLSHLLAQRYYWPTLRGDCQQYVNHCFECQLAGGRPHGSWQGQLLPLPPGPRVEWSLDLVTDLGVSGSARYQLLAAICCFSKFCVLVLLRDRQAATVQAAFRRHVVSMFGVPSAIRTDNGSEFKGVFASYCSGLGIKHRHSMPYTSHSQGQVERLHRTVQTLIRRCLVTLPAPRWPVLVPDIQYAINTTYARSVGCSPYLIMFGATAPTDALPVLPDPTISSVKVYAAAVRRQLQTITRAAQLAHASYRHRSAVDIPIDHVTAALKPGSLAMLLRPAHNKLLTRNAGPFLVLRLVPPHVFLRSLTHDIELKENVKNVRPLRLLVP